MNYIENLKESLKINKARHTKYDLVNDWFLEKQTGSILNQIELYKQGKGRLN